MMYRVVLDEDEDDENENEFFDFGYENAFKDDNHPPSEDKYTFLGYTPTAIDYIRRCTSVDEALEIIEYLKKRHEITVKECKKLSERLQKKGLSVFGTYKDSGFYDNVFLR